MNDEIVLIASDDELADLYLRGRDINCPSCGYNRRDGKDSSCPECGCVIALQAFDRNKPLDPQRLIRLGLLFIALYTAGSVIANTASLVTVLVNGTIPATLIAGAWYFGAYIFWVFILYWTVRLWSKSRKGKLLFTQDFCRPAIAVIVMTFIGVAGHIYVAYLSLLSVL